MWSDGAFLQSVVWSLPWQWPSGVYVLSRHPWCFFRSYSHWLHQWVWWFHQAFHRVTAESGLHQPHQDLQSKEINQEFKKGASHVLFNNNVLHYYVILRLDSTWANKFVRLIFGSHGSMNAEKGEMLDDSEVSFYCHSYLTHPFKLPTIAFHLMLWNHENVIAFRASIIAVG